MGEGMALCPDDPYPNPGLAIALLCNLRPVTSLFMDFRVGRAYDDAGQALLEKGGKELVGRGSGCWYQGLGSQ